MMYDEPTRHDTDPPITVYIGTVTNGAYQKWFCSWHSGRPVATVKGVVLRMSTVPLPAAEPVAEAGSGNLCKTCKQAYRFVSVAVSESTFDRMLQRS